MPQIGDIEDGYQFLGGDPSKADSWRKAQETPDYQKLFAGKPNDALGAILQFGQGTSFGFGDEAVAALASLGSGTYSEHLQNIRSQMGQFQEENPLTSLGLNVAGGITQGMGLAKALPGAMSQLPNLVKYPLIGALSGAASGAGTAEDDRVKGAQQGALFGAGVSLAGAGAGALFKSPLRWLNNQFRSPNKNAKQAILKALERDGLSLKDARQKLKSLGPEATLADLGPNTQALAGVIAREPSQAKAQAVKFFEERASKIPNRLIPSIRKITGNDKNAFQTMSEIVKRRSTESAPLYKSAEQQAVPLESMQRVLSGLDDLALGREGSSIGRSIMSWRNKLTEKNGIPRTTIRQLHAIKQDLDDQISTSFRAGKNSKGAALMDVKRLLLSEIDQAVPDYAQARSIFSTESSMKDALELGRRILRDDFDEMSSIVEGMSKAEKEVFVTGAIKTIRDKFLSAKVGNNSARMLSAPLLRERMRNIFPDDDSFKSFMSQLDTEELFQATRAEVLKGSQTAARQAAEGSVKQETRLGFNNYLRDVLEDLTGRPKEQTIEAMGSQLFTRQPNLKELEQIIPNLTEEQKRRISDALLITAGGQAGQL